MHAPIARAKQREGGRLDEVVTHRRMHRLSLRVLLGPGPKVQAIQEARDGEQARDGEHYEARDGEHREESARSKGRRLQPSAHARFDPRKPDPRAARQRRRGQQTAAAVSRPSGCSSSALARRGITNRKRADAPRRLSVSRARARARSRTHTRTRTRTRQHTHTPASKPLAAAAVRSAGCANRAPGGLGSKTGRRLSRPRLRPSHGSKTGPRASHSASTRGSNHPAAPTIPRTLMLPTIPWLQRQVGARKQGGGHRAWYFLARPSSAAEERARSRSALMGDLAFSRSCRRMTY